MSLPLKVFMVIIWAIGIGFLLYVPGLLVIIVAWSGYKWWRDNKRGTS
jgi:nicotinamide riboside transporter PnuC